MSTRRAARVDDGATVKLIRSVTPPLSSSRKLPSPSNPLHSDKENINNRRRSTSRESASNPTQKPVIRPVPRISTSSVSRGRTPSPTEFHKIHRVSVDRVAVDPTHGKEKTDLNKSKVQTRSRSSFDGNGSSKSEFKFQSDGNKKNESVKSNKYQSKLHEKLAFLEGKVKRIASDIKKTKEMLDMNNPDASKVILSDIQDKISGIEKAMVHVVTTTTHDDDDGVDEKKNKQLGMVDKKVSNDGFQGGEGKSFVKGLNSEELEARLLPHHKLIRDRTLIKGKDDDNCSVVKPKVEDKVLSPVDHNSIAMEFLDSLGNEKSKVSVSTRECEVQETGGGDGNGGNKVWESNEKCDIDLLLQANEILEELDQQENKMEGQGQGQGQGEFVGDEMDEAFNFKLNEIGNKIAAAGWFLSEGEAVLLAHDDASCSYYDITNCEEKAVYLPPPEVSPNMWRDCWVIRAHGYDGCSGKFVVAASAGNTMDSGFCSWDFYTKEVRAFQMEIGTTSSRSALRPLPNNIVQRRCSESSILAPETRQCWYKPCGTLISSTASSQRAVKVFDVRDGEQIMTWDVQNPVIAMEYSSPLQWRNRGKIVVADSETISLWDVNSPSPQALLSVPLGGRKVSALHVSNTDAELGGGVRRRVSSSEAEGNDGVFCTSDSINVLDFRQPSGVGLRISKHGDNVQSVFCRGDSVFLGCSSSSSMGKKQSSSVIQQFSLRRGGLFSTYALPESNTNSHAAISQVWGNSDFVMGVCGLGLCVFDALKNDALRELKMDYSNAQSLREVVGPDDLYCPSFDYLGSRALLISRDRPAMWRHLIV